MSLDSDQVHRVAELARLSITDADLPLYASELSAILDMVDQLRAADTQGVVPMAHPLAMVQRLRADDVSECDRREDFIALAPESADGLFLVPQVIE